MSWNSSHLNAAARFSGQGGGSAIPWVAAPPAVSAGRPEESAGGAKTTAAQVRVRCPHLWRHLLDWVAAGHLLRVGHLAGAV
jgi:hypothetical protein